MAEKDAAPPNAAPFLRIVRGEPDDAEVAALTTVLAGLASAAGADPARPRPRSRWADPASRLRVPPRPGDRAWRRSAYPA